MSEFDHQPNPEEMERLSLVKIIKEYLPDDLDYLTSEHPDTDDLWMAVYATLANEGYDPEEIMLSPQQIFGQDEGGGYEV